MSTQGMDFTKRELFVRAFEDLSPKQLKKLQEALLRIDRALPEELAAIAQLLARHQVNALGPTKPMHPPPADWHPQ